MKHKPLFNQKKKKNTTTLRGPKAEQVSVRALIIGDLNYDNVNQEGELVYSQYLLRLSCVS